jgi:hypothetical protein
MSLWYLVETVSGFLTDSLAFLNSPGAIVIGAAVSWPAAVGGVIIITAITAGGGAFVGWAGGGN